MRVLLTNHFPFEGSATGTSTYDLAMGLMAAGHEVRVLVVDLDRRSREAFPVRRVICRSSDPHADLPFDLPSFTTHPQSRLTYFNLTDDQVAQYRDVLREAIDEEVARFDPHVIHCQHLWVQAALVLETGVPYVASAQETNLEGYYQDPRYQLWAEQGAENAGKIIAESRWMADEVQRIFNIDNGRVVTVPSGIDTKLYQTPATGGRDHVLARLNLPPHPGPIVAYGGKLLASQGVDVLLKAAQIYEKQLPSLMTVVAGDGPEYRNLTQLSYELGLKHTHFLGHHERVDLAAVYQVADLVVVPARTDPFELVPIEALASGTPVVASRVGGMPEVVREEFGGLVEPDSPEELAAMVQRALQEGWKAKKGPQAARYAAAEHGLDQWTKRIADIYREVVESRTGPL